MPNTLAQIRRELAIRMGIWGGSISGATSGTLTAAGTANTAIDTNRYELDDEWNGAWIVLNPGSSDQVNSPTIWRQIAAESGWVQASSTFTLSGTWPSPYLGGPPNGTPYEVYKLFKPEQWLKAINTALRNSYPERSVSVNFDVPENTKTHIIDWDHLVKEQQVSDPTSLSPSLAAGTIAGSFLAGQYTAAFTFYNDLGETLQSATSTITLTAGQSLQFNAIANVPAAAVGCRYYISMYPGTTQLGMRDVGDGSMISAVAGDMPGFNNGGTIPMIVFPDPPSWDAKTPPTYNETQIDIQDLSSIQRRGNPGQYPEVWTDLGADKWRPLGGSIIQINYFESGAGNLRLVCTAPVPNLVNETDSNTEPLDVILPGAEKFLFQTLLRQSPAEGVVYQPLIKAANDEFEAMKQQYKLDQPRKTAHRPFIVSVYPQAWG